MSTVYQQVLQHSGRKPQALDGKRTSRYSGMRSGLFLPRGCVHPLIRSSAACSATRPTCMRRILGHQASVQCCSDRHAPDRPEVQGQVAAHHSAIWIPTQHGCVSHRITSRCHAARLVPRQGTARHDFGHLRTCTVRMLSLMTHALKERPAAKTT